MNIRVLLVDDDPYVREGVRSCLSRHLQFDVVGEASNGQEAIDLVRDIKPDVLIMDIMMPRMNGIQAAEQIQNLKLPTHILLLSMYSDAGFVHTALQCGVKGYVLKSSVSDELLQAVRIVAGGDRFLSGPISELIEEGTGHSYPPSHDDPFASLSPREKEVMKLIAEGHTNVEIGKILFISDKTVEKHREKLMKKLNVRNLAGLVRLAIKHHLVDLEG